MRLVSFGDEYCTKNTATDMVANLLGYKFVDQADPLMTNARIFRDVVRYTTEHNYEDCVFLIGWTTPYKMDAEHGGEYFVYSPDIKNYPSRAYNKLHKYDSYLFDEILINNTWVGLAYGLQEYLLSLNVKYFMYNTQENIMFNTHTRQTLKNLDGRLYHNPLNKGSTMLYHLKQQGYHKIDNQAHKAWADFIIQKLRAGGVIERS